MVNKQLLQPKSIVVIGASNNIIKPDGNMLKNILNAAFKEVSNTDLAILANIAKDCPVITKPLITARIPLLSLKY